MRGQLQLVLIGKTLLPIPKHPRIHHLGFLTDRQKFDAMAAADVLIMPSYFESLSMVALEAWALGKPVLANGRCDVLKGQAIRSNAGLYYEIVRGVRRSARRHRVDSIAGADAWPEWCGVFHAPLRVAGHRTQVPGDARSGSHARDPPADRSIRCLASLDAAVPNCPPPGMCSAAFRLGRACHDEASDPSGARDAWIRRRHRSRGTGDPARPPVGWLRVGHLRRDRGSAARGSDLGLPRV